MTISTKKPKLSPLEAAMATAALADAECVALQQRIAAVSVELKTRRAAVSASILAWQRSSPVIDAGAEFRASSLHQRREAAAGRGPAQSPQPKRLSVIDAVAAGTSARRGQYAGGGDAFRRGGQVTKSLALARPRLPSER